jgi:acetyl esterase/lipase
VRRAHYRYGPRRAQFGELTLPESTERLPPVVIVLHGGYWRGLYSYRLMRPLARQLAASGFAVWNVEYRRVGLGGAGGGWPATFEDVAAAIDFLGTLETVDPSRLATCGHSAGGHLALWAAGRHRLAKGTPGARPDQALRGAVSLAGLPDLEHLGDFGLGHDAIDRLLGGTIEQVPERFHAASPAALLPFGVPQLLTHGLDDSTIPPGMSERYAKQASELGDEATYLPLPGVNHRQIIEVRHHAVDLVASYLEALLA